MEEIYIDISKDLGCSINVIQGDNNSKTYKLIVTDNNKRLDLTGKSVKMAYVNTFGDGDIIEGLQITNAVQGEISLPITNTITKQDGSYGCQLAIYNSSGFLEHTGSFSLIVKENLFNKISSGLLKTTTYQKLISILEKSEEMVANLHDAREVNSSLSNNINSGTNLNTNLSSNIRDGNSLNAALTQNKQDAAVKNTELNKSLEETKKYIDGLDGSQNIPQIRLDVTELQNGLKANQSLEYEGYNVTCNNTLEGRTEEIELKGRTLKNVLPEPTTSNYLFVGGGNIEGNAFVLPFGETANHTAVNCRKGKALLKPNEVYTMVVNIISNDTNHNLGMSPYLSKLIPSKQSFDNKIGISTIKCTVAETLLNIDRDAYFVIWASGGDGTKKIKFQAMLLEGDWTNKEIPQYFEGIKSVGEAEINLLEESQIVDGYITKEGSQYKFITGSNTATAIIPCDPNTTYTIVKEKPTDRFAVGVRDSPIENGSIVDVLKELYTTSSVITVTTPSYARYIAVYLTKNITNEPVGKVGIYKSVNSLQWNPYNKAKISTLSTGKNLVENKFILNRTLASDGTTAVDYYADRFTTEEYSIINIGDYIISCSRNFNGVYVAEYDCNKKFIVRTFISQGNKFIINNTKTRYIRLSILGVTDFENLTLQVEKGSVRTSFQPYQRDKKEFLLNQPLRGLSNICDKIYEKDGKVVLEQNIDKMNLSGNDDLTWLVKNDSGNTILFYIDGASMSNVFKKGSELMCNTFPKIIDTWGSDIEGINIDGYCSLQIRINKNKLATQDVNGFKKWLQDNPVTVYYQRASAIITELNIKDLDLSVFQDVTHIMSTNSIPATLDFKIPTNYGSVLQQQSKNINDLYKIIDEILVPQVTSNTLDIELLKNK